MSPCNEPHNQNIGALNLSHCTFSLRIETDNRLVAMKKTDDWRLFFIFVLASSFFLLAGPASPFLVIILVFITLVCANFYRRITRTFSMTHFPLRQGNPNPRGKPDRLSSQQLEKRSQSIRNKVSDARKRLTATS